ncbi:DNA repair protein RAD33 [Cyberlindnera fabianii]|uniref:DNA repair protein RAD33 n=1 Tax=Cyberlindnera fabianii TaxID=36022 RepID=A0A1V2L131_CYBFA|nr:DNA repair protein RAD33 [Cyberlindnera fabianii]
MGNLFIIRFKGIIIMLVSGCFMILFLNNHHANAISSYPHKFRKAITPIEKPLPGNYTSIMARKYITKKSIGDFIAPAKLPAHYEDEILDAFANYSIEQDMKTTDLPSLYNDLRVPRDFIIGNKRLRPEDLSIEGTDVIDFDKMLTKAYHLLLFRDNEDEIKRVWDSLIKAAGGKGRTGLNVADLKRVETELKLGISDTLLLDMVAVGAEGQGVEVTIVDFAYILGKLGYFKE